MLHNIFIINVSEGVYRTSGFATQLAEKSKAVEVDGERYYKSWREEVKIDLDAEWEKDKDKDFKLNWNDYKTDFLHLFGLNEITLWAYSNAHTFITGGQLSDNEYVAFLEVLAHEKLIPFEIYRGKMYEKTIWLSDLKDGVRFPYVLNEYGYNNCVWTYITFQEYLKYSLPNRGLRNLHYGLAERFFSYDLNKCDEAKKTEILIEYINRLKTA